MVFMKSAAASGGNDENKIRENFWRTAKKAARHVPFMEDVVAAYYCALDKETPLRVKGILFAALGYFILPADTIPDVIFGLGFTDDVAVLTAALAAVRAPYQAGASGGGERGSVAGLMPQPPASPSPGCRADAPGLPAQLLPLSWLSSASKGLSAVACPGGGQDGGCGTMAAMKLLASDSRFGNPD